MNDRDLLSEADQLALAFLNAARHEGLRGDPGALTAWLLHAGLATEADVRRLTQSPPLARIAFDEGLTLLDAVGDVVEAFQRGAPLPHHAVQAVNRALEGRRVGLRLLAHGPDAALAEEVDIRFPAGLLAPVAAAAAQLLSTGDRSRLRRCDAEACGRWFYDVSRNGRRRWCSMARCGNRAKVAAHYRRRRAEEERVTPEPSSPSTA